MLEDRIIVQDRGIDAGLAALMQNANKGMDPAALMAMMNNNGGFGGNGGWWWIWIILIWFCWGGNGFGGRNAGALASELNTDANTNPPFWGAGFPFFFGRRRRRLNTISGIPVLRTTGVVTTSTEVRYDVNYADYRSLPNEGLFFLDVRQASPTASASLPVGLSDSESDNTTQSLLRNALQEDVQAGDLQVNFRYLIYYNKCNNTYQLVNAYPANIATPGA